MEGFGISGTKLKTINRPSRKSSSLKPQVGGCTRVQSRGVIPPLKSSRTKVLEAKTAPKPKKSAKNAAKILTLAEKAEKLLSIQVDEKLANGAVNIRFNHKNSSFKVHNGIMKWSDIDDEYVISFVYKGAFRRDIYLDSEDKDYDKRNFLARCPKGDYFFVPTEATRAFSHGKSLEYKLELEEDPQVGIGAEGLRLNAGPIRASSSAVDDGSRSGNVQMDELTRNLKQLHAKGELDSEEARAMLEARDIEDILFSV